MLNTLMILIVLIEAWLVYKIGFWAKVVSRLSRFRGPSPVNDGTQGAGPVEFDKSRRTRLTMIALGGLFISLWIVSYFTMLHIVQLLVLAVAMGVGFLLWTKVIPARSAMFSFGGLFMLLLVLPYVLDGHGDAPPSPSVGPVATTCPQLSGERDDTAIRTPLRDVNDGRYGVSIDALERLATLHRWLGWAGFGSVDHYNVLASLYEQQRQYQESFDLYKEASDEGNMYGEFNVARFYLDGKSTQKQPEAALHYFRLAAAQNLAAAQYGLGVMYADGIGVKCDISQAITSWFKAGRQGYAPAIAALGLRDLGHAKAMLEREPIDIDFADPQAVMNSEKKLLTFAADYDPKRTLPAERRNATIEAVKKECSSGINITEKDSDAGNYSPYDGLRSWYGCYSKAENSLF